MADDLKPASRKPHPAIFLGVALIALVILGFAQFTSQVDKEADQAAEQAAVESTGAPTDTAAATDPDAAPAEIKIDANAALSDRILGSTSAPVKIAEHASFTCGHCGEFHRTTFAALKKEYLDTGKAYLVFSDFPLNEPAIHASMIARCLPEAKYFDFVSLLFEKQDDWAYDTNYMTFLKAEAGKAGLNEAGVDACLANKEIEEGIKNRMKGVASQWNIGSTPSFVINNRNTISGALPIEEFRKILDAQASGQSLEAPTGATETAPAPPEQTREEAPASNEPAAEEEATPEPITEAPAATTETPAPATATTESEEGATKAE